MSHNAVRTHLTNAAIIGVIIAITLGVTVVALASKVSAYQDTTGIANLFVNKKQYKLLSFSAGNVAQVNVTVGQYVTKGTPLLTLSDETLQKEITVLKGFAADNVSAQTQLAGLEVQLEKLVIYAPVDGVVATIANEGDPVSEQEQIGSMYAAQGVELDGAMDLADYQTAQNARVQLMVTSARLGQSYAVELSGLQQQVSSSTNQSANIVNPIFVFVNPGDATNLLQNEHLTLNLRLSDSSNRPFTKVVNWYRSIFDRSAQN